MGDVEGFQCDQPAPYDMPKLATLFKERKAAWWSPVDIQTILPTSDRTIIEARAREMYEINEGFSIWKDDPDLSGIGRGRRKGYMDV